MSIFDDIALATAQVVDAYPSEVIISWKATPDATEYLSRTVTAAAHTRARADGFDDFGSRMIGDAITVTAKGSDFSDEEILLINQDARMETGGINYKVQTMARTAQNGVLSITGMRE